MCVARNRTRNGDAIASEMIGLIVVARQHVLVRPMSLAASRGDRSRERTESPSIVIMVWRLDGLLLHHQANNGVQLPLASLGAKAALGV
jgi:hypothetical protein